MRSIERICLFCVVLLSVITAYPDLIQEPERTEILSDQKSFVRMDLLVLSKKGLETSQRNIFKIQTSGEQEWELPDVPGERKNSARDETGPLEEPASSSFNIRYIGYVKSGRKITALIVFGGEALAVEQGEEIALGLKIVEITVEEIGVIGPNQELKKFPLEGDQP